MRYRVVTIGYVLAAAVGPLAFIAAAFRSAPPAGGSLIASPAASAVAMAAAPAVLIAALIAAALLVVLAGDVVRLRRVKRNAVPIGTVAIRHARVGTSRTVSTPTAIGYLHPAVVLPEGFRDRVDAREYDAVLAHECAHLARRDDWAKAFQSAVLRAGWWMPGLWVLSRALDLERELASDERAAGETGARRYAACLLRLATARGTDAVAPGLWGRRSHVAIRVERLLRPVAGGAPLVRAGALGAFTALAFSVVAAAVLAVPGTGAPVTAATRPAAARPVVIARTVVAHHPARPVAHARRPAARVISFVETAAAAAPEAAAAATPRTAVAKRVTVRAGDAVPTTSKQPAAARASAASVQPALVAVVVNRPAAAREEPGRRIPDRRPAPFRPVVAPEVLAYAAAPAARRCATCFGPLRSPDVAVPSPAPVFPTAAGGSGTGNSAITVGDPGSGPIDLNAGLIWYRIPARIIQLP
ncbi:MAG TPA: M56 family metallopeptidase [Candidatus Elarobacter sp.]|nr:M56 family metallopeptidase [Candidatus Elarobacter sp.]